MKDNRGKQKNTEKGKETDPVPNRCLPILWGSHNAMDFSQFRETGELSDITVRFRSLIRLKFRNLYLKHINKHG